MKPNLLLGFLPARRILPAVLFSALFFGFLWLLDFPKPFIDDLCYTGAAMNLAQGGDFSNPFLARYFPAQHLFFIYPPVHSYTLAGWFKIFGISAASATGFQLLMYFIMAVAVITILSRNQAPAWMGWLVPFTTATFLENGLRTEPLAAALTWTGFAIIECGARKRRAVFFAFLFMFLAGATAPRNGVFVFALILLAAWRLWQDAASRAKGSWHFILPVAAALATAFLIFLLMIHFKFSEFCSALRLHSSALNTGTHSGLWQKALLVVGGIMVVLGWPYRSDNLMQICLALGAAFAIALVSQTLNFGPGGWHALLIILFLSATLIKRAPQAGRWVLQSALCLLLLWKNIPLAVQVYGIISGQISSNRGGEYLTARTLTSTPEQQLFLDPIVARYCFDYRIPPGSIDFAFAAPFPRVGTVMADLVAARKPGDTYLLNPRFRDYVERSTHLAHERRERWTWLGVSFDKYPRKVYIIRAEDCQGLKSAIERPF